MPSKTAGILFAIGLHVMAGASMAAGATGFYEPADPKFSEALATLNRGDSDGALAAVSSLRPSSPEERYWKSYIQGIALFAKAKYDEGYKPLAAVYDEVRQSKAKLEPGILRLTGAVLKKIGWYWRNKKEFEKAYAYHDIEYNIYELYGSPQELHDACISLDVDSSSMGDFRQSEIWLRRSLKTADRITESKAKAYALGMSHNNLAEALSMLNRFEEAAETMQLSLKHWSDYEKEAGAKDFRVLWAHFGVADVNGDWAKYLKENHRGYAKQKKLAIDSYRTALKLAEQQGLPAKEKADIAGRLAAIETL